MEESNGLISGNGLWEKAAFNDRLRVMELGPGNGVAHLNLWRLNYGCDEVIGGGTANTGDLVRQTSSVEGRANPFVQT